MGFSNTAISYKCNSLNGVSKNISNLLEKRNMSESDLARVLNLPYNTIHRLINGSTTDPRISTLKSIANYFSISLDDLISNQLIDTPNKQNKQRSIPLLNWDYISNANFDAKSTQKNYRMWHSVGAEYANELGLHSFAIESRPSLSPRFPNGSILIADPDEHPRDKDYVLIKIKETNDVAVRELLIDPPVWQLHSICGNSPVLLFDKGCHEILGVIVLTLFKAR